MNLSPRARRWGAKLAALLVGQSFVQGINFATGLLLIRWLDPVDYARYSLVFAFQCTLGMFVDLGFGGCIVSLVGARGDRPEVIGGYIAAARWFRTGLLAVLVPASAAVFYVLGARQGWPPAAQAVLFACVAVSLYFEGIAGWFSAPLLIHGRLADLYRIQIVGSLARLGACLVSWAGNFLGAVSLAIINTVVYGFTGWRYQAATRRDVRVPPRADPALRREMVRYLGPLIPGVAFTAIQGQLGVFLITYFGKSQNVAEVAALGRLGQLFILLGAVNATLVTPYFARLPSARLGRWYAGVLGAAVLGSVALATAAFLCPWPLLWLLGGSYRHLEREFGWMMVGNCLGFIAGVMWAIHSARKWIYWWGSGLYIVLLATVQAVFIAHADLGSTLTVQLLGVATGAATVLVHVPTAIAGFLGERHAPVLPLSTDPTPPTHTILPDELPVPTTQGMAPVDRGRLPRGRGRAGRALPPSPPPR